MEPVEVKDYERDRLRKEIEASDRFALLIGGGLLLLIAGLIFVYNS